MSETTNTLFVVSAPSGSGKTSIMRAVMGQEREVVSFTTRAKRESEVDGKDYVFISKERFNELDALGEIVEKTQYPPNDPNGNYYGVLLDELQSKLKKGSAFIVVDAIGMEQIKAIHPKCVTIWIYTNKADATKSMIARGDKVEAIESRLATFDLEQTHRTAYDYIITNEFGKMWETVEIIKGIVIQKG